MNATNVHSVGQMRVAAQRRLPGFVFDFIDGGAGGEFTMAQNEAAFARYCLIPRMLRGVADCNLSTVLFGTTYAAPFGIAPMGMVSVAWPGTEVGLARTAAKLKIPVALSTVACATIEQTVTVAPGYTWFQLYPGSDPKLTFELVEAASQAGVKVLIVTVDRPVMGWRVRDLTHGVGPGFRLNLRAYASIVLHPSWGIATLRAGRPKPAYARVPPTISSVDMDWTYIAALRARWPHALLVKGILHPEDAVSAVSAGADGVVVSNHGGAHLESAPASIDRLPQIRAAVGTGPAVLLDGGVRTGEDVAKALALGANFVLLGRPFAYGAGAFGPRDGPSRVGDIVIEQLRRTLILLGCRTPAELNREYICPN